MFACFYYEVHVIVGRCCVSIQRVIFQYLKNYPCWFSLISSAHCSQSDAIWKSLCNQPSAILPVLLAWNIFRTLLNMSCQIKGRFRRLEIQTYHWTTAALLCHPFVMNLQRTKAKSQDKEVTSEFLSFLPTLIISEDPKFTSWVQKFREMGNALFSFLRML